MPNLQPKDVVALVALVGIFVLKSMNLNGGLDTAGALIIGYYFGHRANGVDKGV